VGAAIAVWNRESWPLLAMPVVLFVRMALNAIDGMLAREHNMQSALGGFLNELSDVVADAALYLPLALVAGVDEVYVVLVILLATISELAGVVSVQVGGSRRYDGPMGKSDRAFVFGAICLLLGLKVEPGVWLDLVLIATLVLLTLTIVNRVRRGLAEVN
jgi:CDP-diacylglycerol--glycerol-3-phosphate 3-phosphatidyltransferase